MNYSISVSIPRWTINLALTTANQMFKSSNPFDSQDLVEVSQLKLFIRFLSIQYEDYSFPIVTVVTVGLSYAFYSSVHKAVVS